ncbi:hypothetical protein L210DRAFT_954017 [Boletus edulis BED1]|uniref:Uncharacterized protein n=1 Tax=Boletus edulis BED1 TaxID=1328754 RepID=A0AAD4C7Z8_BOLED|nr:hypothetical protein L210DRAFT_954017 [Boletus edulis BED1]
MLRKRTAAVPRKHGLFQCLHITPVIECALGIGLVSSGTGCFYHMPASNGWDIV